MKSEWSRREFLSAGASTVATTTGSALVASTALPASATEFSGREGRDSTAEDGFAQPGSPSREAYRALAEAERDHQLRMRDRFAQEDGSPDGQPTSPTFARAVNAVEDLGADPTASRPISNDIGSGIRDGTLIVFPPGRYLLDGDLQASVGSGTFGMVGAGYESASGPPQPGEQAATFVAPSGTQARLNFDARSGLLANIVLDQRQQNAGISFVLNSSGFTHARDIRLVGITDATGSGADEASNHPLCALIADEGATARVERFVALGTGYPGDKNVGGVPAIWVGDGNRGTAQIVECQIQASADNGIYGSRTPGDTQIVGGTYRNNEVAQIRFCGRGSFADGATLVIDAENYSGPVGDSGGFGEKIATNGVKIEQPSHISKAGGAVLRNADVRGLSGDNIGSLVFVRGHGGALKIDNCRIANALSGTASLRASRPGSSYDPASPPPHNITIADSLFTGSPSLDEVVAVEGREQSLVTNTCFQIPGITPSALSGIQVGEGVGFGEACSAGGLANPDAVGSGGNLSAVNFSAANGSYNGSAASGATATQTPPRARARGAGSGSFFASLFGGFFGGIGLLLMMMLLVPVGFLALLWELLSS